MTVNPLPLIVTVKPEGMEMGPVNGTLLQFAP
jgi:hypothetical protein